MKFFFLPPVLLFQIFLKPTYAGQSTSIPSYRTGVNKETLITYVKELSDSGALSKELADRAQMEISACSEDYSIGRVYNAEIQGTFKFLRMPGKKGSSEQPKPASGHKPQSPLEKLVLYLSYEDSNAKSLLLLKQTAFKKKAFFRYLIFRTLEMIINTGQCLIQPGTLRDFHAYMKQTGLYLLQNCEFLDQQITVRHSARKRPFRDGQGQRYRVADSMADYAYSRKARQGISE